MVVTIQPIRPERFTASQHGAQKLIVAIDTEDAERLAIKAEALRLAARCGRLYAWETLYQVADEISQLEGKR